MATPEFSAAPTAPDRADPATFDARADTFTAWMRTFRDELAAAVTWMVDQVADITGGGSDVTTLTSTSNITAIDMAGNAHFVINTLGENTEIANPTNVPAAGKTKGGTITVIQDATGGRVVTWDTNWVDDAFGETTTSGTTNVYAYQVNSVTQKILVQHIRSY